MSNSTILDHTGFLQKEDYIQAFSRTQIVCADFVIYNRLNNKILLGKRNNPPAKGFYFVPGGRIFKGEPVNEGIRRVIKKEIGFVPKKLTPIGVYEHKYPNDNPMGIEGVSGDYIVFGMKASVDTQEEFDTITKTMSGQHEECVWVDVGEVFSRDDVHQYTKNYLIKNAENKII